jgi:hypothetical protein
MESEIPVRIGHLEADRDRQEEDIRHVRGKLETWLEELMGLLRWKRGNGARGAEDRLQCMEEKMYQLQLARLPERMGIAECDIEALQKVADGRIGEVVKKTLDARDKTVIAYIKAFGPWVTAVAALLVVILGG